MRLQDYDTRDRFTGWVVSTQLISPTLDPEVRELVLEVDRPLHAFAGQSIGVLAPEETPSGHAWHFRLYTLADQPGPTPVGCRVTIAVRRCNDVDEDSGESHRGVSSNFLCDRRSGDEVSLCGPFGIPFPIPEQDGTLVLIGMGTGIAPFRALVRRLFNEDWGGRVLLFHGGRTGLDLIYQNDERDDFAFYMDKPTFQAVKVLSRRPYWHDDADWETALAARRDELRGLLEREDTHIYMAGLTRIRERLDEALAKVAGSDELWQERKAELKASGRLVELLY
jgi:ferredoxin--NADP+ reductase